MPTPEPPVSPTVSPKTWAGINQAALVGRFVLLPASVLSILATFIDTPGIGALAKVFLTLLALAVATLAVLGTVKPLRAFDAGAVAIALVLSGTWGFYAFSTIGVEFVGKLYILQFFAWLPLLAGALAVGAVLLIGPTPTVPFKIGGPSAPQAWGPPTGYQQAGAPTQAQGPAPTGYGAPAQSAPSPGGPAAYAPPAPEPQQAPAAPAAPAASDAPEPGWYPAPDGVNARWWDGSTWTGERRPLSDFDDDASA